METKINIEMVIETWRQRYVDKYRDRGRNTGR